MQLARVGVAGGVVTVLGDDDALGSALLDAVHLGAGIDGGRLGWRGGCF